MMNMELLVVVTPTSIYQIICTRICKLRLKNGISSMIEKCPSGMPKAVFSEYKFHDRFYSTEWIPINYPYFIPSTRSI